MAEVASPGIDASSVWEYYAVPPLGSGTGPPYAPEGWTWRVGRRERNGVWLDRYYKPPGVREMASRKAVEAYLLEINFPMDPQDFLEKYRWGIPILRGSADSPYYKQPSPNNEESPPTMKPRESSPFRHKKDNPRGQEKTRLSRRKDRTAYLCPKGTQGCGKGSSFGAALGVYKPGECRVCCEEANFCRACCCLFCGQLVRTGDDEDGWNGVQCLQPLDGLACGHVAHMTCAIQNKAAGVEQGADLDGQYRCRRCEQVSDLYLYWKACLRSASRASDKPTAVAHLKAAKLAYQNTSQPVFSACLDNIQTLLSRLESSPNGTPFWPDLRKLLGGVESPPAGLFWGGQIKQSDSSDSDEVRLISKEDSEGTNSAQRSKSERTKNQPRDEHGRFLKPSELSRFVKKKAEMRKRGPLGELGIAKRRVLSRNLGASVAANVRRTVAIAKGPGAPAPPSGTLRGGRVRGTEPGTQGKKPKEGAGSKEARRIAMALHMSRVRRSVKDAEAEAEDNLKILLGGPEAGWKDLDAKTKDQARDKHIVDAVADLIHQRGTDSCRSELLKHWPVVDVKVDLDEYRTPFLRLLLLVLRGTATISKSGRSYKCDDVRAKSITKHDIQGLITDALRELPNFAGIVKRAITRLPPTPKPEPDIKPLADPKKPPSREARGLLKLTGIVVDVNEKRSLRAREGGDVTGGGADATEGGVKKRKREEGVEEKAPLRGQFEASQAIKLEFIDDSLPAGSAVGSQQAPNLARVEHVPFRFSQELPQPLDKTVLSKLSEKKRRRLQRQERQERKRVAHKEHASNAGEVFAVRRKRQGVPLDVDWPMPVLPQPPRLPVPPVVYRLAPARLAEEAR